jgi:hypothetical protein
VINPINYQDENGDYIFINKIVGHGIASFLYEDGVAYNYTKDKDGNIVKEEKWGGTDESIKQTISDLNDISSLGGPGKTVVNDLVSSKFAYKISADASKLDETTTEPDYSAKGGTQIHYWQKGGSTFDAATNRSAVVLGHELFHAWSFEFIRFKKPTSLGDRIKLETAAVEFENYLRASFGEERMRTDYYIRNEGEFPVGDASVEDAINYKLPMANYWESHPMVNIKRNLEGVDATYIHPPVTPYTKPVDSRKQKF